MARTGETPRISVGEVKAALTAQIGRLADELAPASVRRDGHRRWSLNPTRKDNSPNSFVIDVAGATAGRWMEFSGDFGGDAIDLVSYCRITCGGPDYQSREARGRAIQWAKAWLGLEQADPDMMRRTREAAERARERAEKQEHASREERDRRAKRARDWWLKSGVKDIAGTVIDTYLRQRRAIRLDELDHVPGSIRFLPEDLADHETGEICPAMFACMVSSQKRQIRAVHRTFLREDGTDKADLESPRKIFGDYPGCTIPLARGATGKNVPDAIKAGVRDDVMALSEGIEDGLSWHLMHPAHRVEAVGVVGNFQNFRPPACVGRIVIVGQNDPPGSIARKTADEAVSILARKWGLPVTMERPKPPFKDFNDVWKHVCSGGD